MDFGVDDYGSTEDELDDYLGIDRSSNEWRNKNGYRFELSEEQKREQQLTYYYSNLTNGRVNEVISALDNEGLDVNHKFQNDWTPILVAASTANYDLIVELVKRGADIHSNRDGHSVLMLAANCPSTTATFEETTKLVQYFIDSGLNPNAINKKRMNALMFAAKNGNLEAVKVLVPVTDINALDNQRWNALFWAVSFGHYECVKYFIDIGLPFDKPDVRNNIPLEVARENFFDDLIPLLTIEEDFDFFVDIEHSIDFESIFKDLKVGEKPRFFFDITKMLHGMRCENMMKLFSEQNVGLYEFLSATEDDLENLGVEMPFQRRRLMIGIYKFHKYAYHPKSIPVVGKNELYCTTDVAAAVLSAVKQIIVMNASLTYLIKNRNEDTFSPRNKEIRHSILVVEQNLNKLKAVVKILSQKTKEWDTEIQPINVITSKSGKRWFPWRKAMFSVGIAIIISLKLWKKPLFH